MTAPYMQPPTPEQIDMIRAEGRRRKVPPEVIEQKLVDAGLIQATVPRQGIGQQMATGAGQLARMGVAGIGNMASMPFGLAGLAYRGVTGNQPPAMLQGGQGTATADQIGLPQYPNSPAGRMLGAAGENMVGGAMLPGGATAGRMALGGAAGTAGQGAAEAGVGPMGQMAASLAVGAGFPVVGTALAGGIRAALAGAASRRAAAQQAEALREQGAAIPGQIDELADELGPAAKKTTVGRAVKLGIQKGFIPNFRAQRDALYEKATSLVPPTTGVRPTAIGTLIAKQNDLLGMARELSDDIVNPKIAGMLNRLDEAVTNSPDGTIPFAVLKEMRSRLFAIQSGDELVPEINMRDVGRLIDATTEDMGATVQRVAGTPGTQAWNRANKFNKAGRDRIDDFLNPITKKRTPEQVWTALMSGTKEGATSLRAVMHSLPEAAQDLVRSNALRQLGRMPDETFDPQLFLRKFHGLNPEARTVLFGSDPIMGARLTELAETAEKLRATSRFNVTGSAPKTSFSAVVNGLSQSSLAVLGALGGHKLGGAAGAAVGAVTAPMLTAYAANRLAERAFTNPRIVEWLTRQTKFPYGALQQQLALLAKESQKWGPEDRQVAQELSGTLSHMDWRAILQAQAGADATGTR